MKNEIDEKALCKRYAETNIGVEALALELHVGKKRIKDILTKNNIVFKKRGGQTVERKRVVGDWKIEKFKHIDGFHYIAEDKKTGFISKDYMNNGGVLTSYIKKEYCVEIPSLYDRREYYMSTGDYWWEQWFTIKTVKDSETKKCPFCDWETNDVENKSGAFEVHLRNKHGISKLEYITRYPHEKEYFSLVSRRKNRQLSTDSKEYVLCAICGAKLARIDNNHLKIHGTNKIEYIKMYGSGNLVSSNYCEDARKHAKNTNKKMKFRKESAQEKEIKEFIKGLGFDVKSDRRVLDGVEIDIYVPSLKIGFEYNGNRFHTESYGKNRFYHLKKTEKAFENGIMLYHIFDDDFFYRKEILLSKIKHILGVSDGEKVRAGKCKIREISKNESDEFLKKYHIQGECSSSVYLGAYKDDLLVAVMLFLNEGNGIWNLTRFATNYNLSIPGIGGKIFSYFKKNYSYASVKSFAERRLTPNFSDNLYVKLGFELVEIGKPDYRYYNSKIDRYKRFHKFGFRKSALNKKYGLPLTMTESEMAKSLGYDRIWDCGLLKYVYNNPYYVHWNELREW